MDDNGIDRVKVCHLTVHTYIYPAIEVPSSLIAETWCKAYRPQESLILYLAYAGGQVMSEDVRI